LQAEPFLKKNSIRELIDPSLADYVFDCRQIKIMLFTASLCIQQSSIRRPSMNQARSLVLCFSSSPQTSTKQPFHLKI